MRALRGADCVGQALHEELQRPTITSHPENPTMPKVTYIEYNDTAHEVDVPIGRSVMQGAVENGVPGIDADCGGACACATCHVYVAPDWLARVGSRGEREEEMLGFAAETQPNSRLACQIKMTAELEGLVVRMPEGQH
jgi:ferredoxin, 2Fe-2S